MLTLADIRYAWRSLLRSPTYAAIAILSIGLGIGASTTVYSLVSAMYFRPLALPDASRLVEISEVSATKLCTGCGVGTSYPTFLDWRERSHSFSALAAYAEEPVALGGDEGAAERVPAGRVTANLFAVLGVAPIVGRDFVPDEGAVGAPPAVLISHALWQRRFAGDSAVAGRTLRVNGQVHSIIGVMPPRFKFPEYAELWTPLAATTDMADRNVRGVDVVARLRPGVTMRSAGAELHSIGRALAAEYPEAQGEWDARVVPLRDAFDTIPGALFGVLMGAVASVLLIACANVGAIQLSRLGARARELSLRCALGATRWQLARLVLTESVLVALAGGVLGFAVSVWGVEIAVRQISEPIPYWVAFGVDWRVLVFCTLASLASGIVAGLAPAIRASRPDLTTALKDGGPGDARPERRRVRHALVIAQVAVALVLLSGAGTLVRTFATLLVRANTSATRDVLRADLAFLTDRYHDPARVIAIVGEIVDRIEGSPGAAAAATQMRFLAGFGAQDDRMRVEAVADVPAGVSPRFAHVVTPEYFEIAHVPVIAGRAFTSRDRPGSDPVVIVSEATARAAWPGESPVGKRIQFGERSDMSPWMTVIGVVRDADIAEIADSRQFRAAYLPFAQSATSGAVELLVRAPASTDPHSFMPSIRDAVRATDPDLPLDRLTTENEARAQDAWGPRFFAMLMAAFAMFAVVLAAMGIYGLLAHAVERRTREIGVRLALGANRGAVMRMVLRQGVALGGVGIAVGGAGAIALGPVLRHLILDARAFDPAVGAAVVLMLGGAILLASYVPARRAAAVDAMVAMRADSG
jgi:putative ABC transport system permease protein